MVAKAASISHGINCIRYISGESKNKENPELIYRVKDNLLPCELDAVRVWDHPYGNQSGDGTYRKLYHAGLAEAVG